MELIAAWSALRSSRENSGFCRKVAARRTKIRFVFEDTFRMKIIRVPWIRCRADEVDAEPFDMEWRGRSFQVLAYSEREASDWWRSLSEAERSDCFGIETTGEVELF